MSWLWIGVAVTVPSALALLVAWPFWRRDAAIIGNALGAGIIFIAAIAFIGREYVELQRLTAACLEAGRICSFHPEPFTRFAIYGLIGLCEACALFALSIRTEEKLRRKSSKWNWQ